jgi:hypothetical protein
MQVDKWAAVGSCTATLVLMVGLYVLVVYLKYQNLQPPLVEEDAGESDTTEEEGFMFVSMKEHSKGSQVEETASVGGHPLPQVSPCVSLVFRKDSEICVYNATIQSVTRQGSTLHVKKEVEEETYMVSEPEAAPFREMIGDYIGVQTLLHLHLPEFVGELPFSPEMGTPQRRYLLSLQEAEAIVESQFL